MQICSDKIKWWLMYIRKKLHLVPMQRRAGVYKCIGLIRGGPQACKHKIRYRKTTGELQRNIISSPSPVPCPMLGQLQPTWIVFLHSYLFFENYKKNYIIEKSSKQSRARVEPQTPTWAWAWAQAQLSQKNWPGLLSIDIPTQCNITLF